MKKEFVFLWVAIGFISISLPGNAQQSPFQIGIQLQQLQDQFGLGVNVGVFLGPQRIMLRTSAVQHWLRKNSGEGNHQATYQAIRLGSAGCWRVTEGVEVYGEGGLQMLCVGRMLTEQRTLWGGYGVFGFAFYPEETRGASLFLEIGATTAGMRAKLLPGVSAFGAGQIISTGFRVPL